MCIDESSSACQSHAVKSCGPSGSQDLALLAEPERRPPPFLRGSAPLPWTLSGNRSQPTATVCACPSRFRGRPICHRLRPVATAGLFLKKGRVSNRRLVDGTSSGAPGRLDAHLFLGVGRTPCRWELSRLLNSIKGRQAAKAKRELAGTELPVVDLGAGLKGSLRESMCQAAIRILRATAALAALLLRERRTTSA
jgi:hypothetical protein